jgi:hypothetical protein
MDLVHFRKLRTSLPLITRSNKIDWLDDWRVAGIHTGLLPGEWPLAYLETRRDQKGRRVAWLHVVYGKHNNGRGNGTNRTLRWTGRAAASFTMTCSAPRPTSPRQTNPSAGADNAE